MISDADLATQFKHHKKMSDQALGKQYEETRKARSFYDGDTMAYTDQVQFKTSAGQSKRATVQFNKVQPTINAITGFLAQNRRVAKYVAVSDSPAKDFYTRYANAVKEYVRNNANADYLETEQDADMLIGGYGAMDTDLSYIKGNSTTDPNGEILMMRIDPLGVGWDPSANEKNLIDARWAYYWKEYSLDDAKELFDAKEDDFQENTDQDDVGGQKVYNAYGTGSTLIVNGGYEFASQEGKRVRVYNYQWYEYQTFYRAKNPLLQIQDPLLVQIGLERMEAIAQDSYGEYGDMFDFDPGKPEISFDAKVKKQLEEAFGEFLKPVAFKRKCYYTAVISGDHVFTKYKSPCQQGFSIKFKTGIYNATGKFWMGVVHPMMEPARYYNKALTEFMFTIASNSKGGVMVEKGAVEDISAFSRKYAKTDAVIEVLPGALTSGKIQDKARPAIPTGLEGFITLCDASISAASGIDPAFLGSRESANETGILFKRRIKQVTSTIARYVDSITMYQKEQARLLLDLIRIWAENNEGALFEITDGQQEEFIRISADKFAPEYNVTIQEAALTQEDKEETAIVLTQMGDKFLTIGDVMTAKALYSESLGFMNLDGNVKQRINQVLTPQEGQIDPAMAQQLMAENEQLKGAAAQLEAAKIKSEVDLNNARVEKERAQAIDYQNNPELEALTLGTRNKEIDIDERIRMLQLEIQLQELNLKQAQISQQAGA